MIDKHVFQIRSTEERHGKQDMRVLRHQTTVDVLELAPTIRGMGMNQACLEMFIAVNTKMDLKGEKGCIATTWSQDYSILVRCVYESP